MKYLGMTGEDFMLCVDDILGIQKKRRTDLAKPLDIAPKG